MWPDSRSKSGFFFAVIPYASIFLHETVVYLKPGWILPGRAAKVISLFLAGGALLLMILFPERLYTFFNSLFLIAALLWAHWSGSEVIRRFYLTFPVILVPFLVVNGILTGSFIPGEVVWYDPPILWASALPSPQKTPGMPSASSWETFSFRSGSSGE